VPVGTGGSRHDHEEQEQVVPDDQRLKHPGAKSVGWALVQAARLHRARMGDKLAALGLFAGQEQVLQVLASTGTLTMGELARLLRIRPPTASKTVSRLATMGLVERQAGLGDARVVRVRLSEAGLAQVGAIDAHWDEVEAELLRDFDGKERKRLRKLLRRVARSLAEASGAMDRDLEPVEDELDDAAEPARAASGLAVSA
jgi:DNA-binding MarR family transcriptional regulator